MKKLNNFVFKIKLWEFCFSKNLDIILCGVKSNQLYFSLNAQVGDSVLINPAPDVPDVLDDTNDLSKYSYSSEKPDPEMHSENTQVEEEDDDETFNDRPNLSDSMIPLVGDSIMERQNEDIE